MSFLSSISPSLMYLITQMLVCLAIASLIGLLIGWALGKLGRRKHKGRMDSEWRQALSDTEEDHKRVVSRFKKSNQALDDENNNLKTKIAALNSKIDSHRDDVERIKLQSQQTSTQVESSQTEIQNLKTQLNDERAKNQKLQNLTNALKSTSDEKDRMSQQLSAELSEARTNVQTGSIENDENYQALQREVSDLRAASKENAELRQRVATEGREKEEALTELYNARQKLDKIERDNQDYLRATRQLEQEKAGFDSRVNQAVTQAVQSQASNNSELELEVGRLRPMVKTMSAEINQIKEENRDLQNQLRSGNGGGSTSNAQIETLNDSLRNITYERDQLRTRVADHEAQISSLNTRLSGNLNPPDVSDLRRQLAELSAEKGFMASKIDELQQQLNNR